jgi:beta-lactam-binding protein with PASTA domain/predicted Ser/Thr protein kinase
MTQPRLLGERYELGPLIGYGGMAEVHRGRDVRLGRDVAIKVLRSDLARDPSFQVRFAREAQSSAGLNHPSIVAVYDTGEDHTPAGPVPYIVMEFVEGKTLREILNAEQRLRPARAMEITAEVCAALDYSHRNGIVHRDIKPGNVMITRAGAVKVMDFGIARALADNGATVTQTAAVIGTAQYLSPEQARGETVDARSDVYSAGCLLYELIAGSPPFTGDSPVAVAYQHVRENAAPPSSLDPTIPRALDAVVMKSLAKNPLNRYQTAGEMRADLQRILADQPVVAEAVMSEEERTQYIARAAGPAVIVGGGSRAAGFIEDGDGEADDNRLRIAAWIAGVVALIAVIAIGGFLLLRGGNGGSDGPVVATQVAVPSVVGMDPLVAEQTLRNTKLVMDPSRVTEPSATIPAGKVSSQDVAAKQLVDEGSTVTIKISSGVAKVVVPNFVGLTQAQANDKANTSGLQLNITTVTGSDQVGIVTTQNPPAQTQVDPGSVVTVTVPTGKVEIPDVRGKSYEDARAALNIAGFTNIEAGPSIVADPAQVGIVQGMNPSPKSVVTTDTKIVLSVGQLAPTPTPSVTPSTSASVSTPASPSTSASTSKTP